VDKKNGVIAVVGLGYVGLALAVEFGKIVTTIGFDLSKGKIENCGKHCDPTGEVSSEDFKCANKLTATIDPSRLKEADLIIVAVPTPVNDSRQPDFVPLIAASTTVGRHMKRGTIVVYESTVYPGATEEVCIPVLEKESGLRWKKDFHVGYSPERVNPGDKEHSIAKIVKVVAGDNAETLEKIAAVYESIIVAGVHRASSIKVAEAAKVIENTQRDLNIALMNELAIIFDKLDIDTAEVLAAARTKWNFLPFHPGLVGGHCIGVDPYYLTHKAEMLGYHPEVILAGRRINDGMGAFIARRTIKQMAQVGDGISKGARAIVLGLTFKENCPDLRNSKVADIISELKSYGIEVYVHDPIASPAEAEREYGILLVPWEELPQADVILAAVAHRQYLSMPLDEMLVKLKQGGCFMDVKSCYDAPALRSAGCHVWRL
jgi:UDP-N-acetyl-D-galactosamine dehydrogenase